MIFREGKENLGQPGWQFKAQGGDAAWILQWQRYSSHCGRTERPTWMHLQYALETMLHIPGKEPELAMCKPCALPPIFRPRIHFLTRSIYIHIILIHEL